MVYGGGMENQNPYEFAKRRRRAAALKYGPGTGDSPVAPGSMTPDRTGQDEAMAALTKVQQDSQFAEGMGQGLGGVAGSALGLGGGLLAGAVLPGVGAGLTPALMAAGGSLGGMAGKAIGGAWGDNAERKAQTEMDKQRRKALEQEALMNAIMGLRGI